MYYLQLLAADEHATILVSVSCCAVQFYKPKAPVTDVCDADIVALCLKTAGLETYGIGKVGPLQAILSFQAMHSSLSYNALLYSFA